MPGNAGSSWLTLLLLLRVTTAIAQSSSSEGAGVGRRVGLGGGRSRPLVLLLLLARRSRDGSRGDHLLAPVGHLRRPGELVSGLLGALSLDVVLGRLGLELPAADGRSRRHHRLRRLLLRLRHRSALRHAVTAMSPRRA